VHEALLAQTEEKYEHVYTLHAELEGMKLAPAFEKLLEGWKQQGYELVAMRDLVIGREPHSLPAHQVVAAPVPGRSGSLATQGPAFLTS
jgi:peptidoglycan/xylan/chitin deacetylase (PgdA/CDA1 family)